MSTDLDKYLPFADQPTLKPQAGKWHLVAPDGRMFVGESPIHCVRAESATRIPPEVALGRIARSLNEPDDAMAASESVEELSTGSTKPSDRAPVTPLPLDSAGGAPTCSCESWSGRDNCAVHGDTGAPS